MSTHSSLTGVNLHEMKGVADAADDTVAIASSGETVWQTAKLVNMASVIIPFQKQLLHVQDVKSSGTVGGTAPTAAYTTRTLNTEVTNEIAGASLASNTITLPAGTYWCDAYSVVYAVSACKAKIYNSTDSTNLLIGFSDVSVYTGTAVGMTNSLRVSGRFTLASTKNIQLLVYTTTSYASIGLGVQTSYGENEIYSDVRIWKLD